jgi:hypothetical protein
MVSHQCGCNHGNGFLLSVSRNYACHQGWYHFVGRPSDHDIRSLCKASRRRVARIYVVGASLALYFNVFVGIVQSFEKIPALKAMAPTQSESPFKLTQLVALALFVLLTLVAVIRFRPEPIRVR